MTACLWDWGDCKKARDDRESLLAEVERLKNEISAARQVIESSGRLTVTGYTEEQVRELMGAAWCRGRSTPRDAHKPGNACSADVDALLESP